MIIKTEVPWLSLDQNKDDTSNAKKLIDIKSSFIFNISGKYLKIFGVLPKTFNIKIEKPGSYITENNDTKANA